MEKSIAELIKENQSLCHQIGGYKVQNMNYRNAVGRLTESIAVLNAANKKLRDDCSDLKSKYEEVKSKYDKIVALPWYKRIFGF